ncbi:hypothetical protein EDC14_101251 [Hydrogenispora ethanolica]|uniref:Uncharacterized protein n=1 Tax=Hydrogenispora ethanolica TaxID=1082276 RepID=A0A4R1RSJ8_HYDET|nr:GTPase [Hydrogenispora ethanolica]TCL69354.1 hypothetical protein EDC14_101251 [Hydrogenispora ethanolica]
MKNGYCRGCGSVLQSEDRNKPGFIPAEARERSGPLVCQRCFRVTHYNEIGSTNPDPNLIRENITKAITLSDLLVLVVDFSDLTGSLPVWSGFLGDKPYLLVLNKIDLLPERTKTEEVTNYAASYVQHIGLKAPKAICAVSGLKEKGITALKERLQKATASGTKIAILGVSNVGKSSLVKSILNKEGADFGPTISRFPGTTMGLSNWSIFKGRNTLIDTPGLNPGDRFSDRLCTKCASLLLPERKIQQKLWGIKPGKGLIVGGLVGLESLTESEVVVISFASPELMIHRTDNSKIRALLDDQPDWLNPCCDSCRRKIEWVTETITLQPNSDLAISGLGWLSFRRETASLRMTIPSGIRWEIRPAVIGKKE